MVDFIFIGTIRGSSVEILMIEADQYRNVSGNSSGFKIKMTVFHSEVI